MLEGLQDWLLNDATTEFQRRAASYLLASLLNKNVESTMDMADKPGVSNICFSELSPFISRQLEVVYKNEISSPTIPAERRRFAIQSWLWVRGCLVVWTLRVEYLNQIARALVLLNHATVASFVDLLSRVFEDSEIGWDAARAVGQIASGGDDILTKSNHAVIKVCLRTVRAWKKWLIVMLDSLLAKVLQSSTAENIRKSESEFQ